ncbi:MAG TPA: hypothetical protein VJC18_06365 [bacterium]|nr:hypothetical protein [bacterium]
MDDYLEQADLSAVFAKEGVAVQSKTRKINLDLPDSVVQKIDMIADKIGISRQPLIKLWIHEKIREEFAAEKSV